ncbi:ricin-type beta-trefoil lectin domain protein [Streptomyces xanthophaeus]
MDLQLKAEVEGFSQLLVVKNAKAAKHPDLATLRFKLDTVGLNVSTDATTGLIKAVDPAGQNVFTATTPMMWDSGSGAGTVAPSSKGAASRSVLASGQGSAAPADSFVSPQGAKDAKMPTVVKGGTLEIKPDQKLLTAPDTRYPVFIDPSVAWGSRQNWAWAYRSWPTNSYWNTKEDVRVGYERETGGLSRTFFQIDTSNLKGVEVSKSTFRIEQTWAWSCTPTPVELWHTGAISSKTTWNVQPEKIRKISSVNAAKGRPECGAGNIELDTTDIAQQAAAGGWAGVTLGLYAPNESDTNQWKRFDPTTVTLETEYNNLPDTPKALGTSPSTPCSGSTLGNTRVGLHATISDRDGGNLNAEFQIYRGGAVAPFITQVVPVGNGQVATWSVPDDKLPSGGYMWRVRAKDGDNASSSWSAACKLGVDRSRPSKPPVISSAEFPDGRDGWPATTGKARTPGTFTFGANGVSDVKEIVYWTDFEPSTRSVPASGSVTMTPTGSGPHYVYAYSVDKAGNRSDTTAYLYYVARTQTVDGPWDLNGDGNRDIWTVDSRGTLITYAGQGNGKFAPATNGGTDFTGAQIGTFGDWDGDGYNDLVALQKPADTSKKKLWTYANNGQGTAVSNPVELTVACPVKDPALGCEFGDDWNGDDHWHNAEQIIAPGDLNNDSVPDLLVKQGKQLWAYYTSVFGTLDSNGLPVLVGDGDWDKYTVVAPGDLNGDGTPDLWLRDNANGDLLRTYGSKGSDGNVNPAAWGSVTSRVKVASGLSQTAFPTLSSAGDVTGDKMPDLWAVNASGQLATFAGTGTGDPLNVTGINPTPVFLGNISAASAHWKLTGQSGNITPSTVGDFPATTANITFPATTIGGRSTTYAAFAGSASTISTSKPVIDTRKSFTISTWAKVAGSGGLVLSQDGNRSSAFTLYADPSSKEWRFALARGDVDGWQYSWSDISRPEAARFQPDTWTQLTAVYNADTALMSLYVNGALAATGIHQAASSPAPTGSLVAGRYKVNGQPDYFGGLTGGISNLAVYAYAAPSTAPGASGPIRMAAKTSHCLDNDNGRTQDGNKIQVYDCNEINGGNAQKFEIRADGTVRIAGKCLDPAYAGTSDGTLIWLYTCNGSQGQHFLPLANGSFYHPKSGRCVDASNMNTGTQIYLWTCNATSPQRWDAPTLTTAPLPVPLW